MKEKQNDKRTVIKEKERSIEADTKEMFLKVLQFCKILKKHLFFIECLPWLLLTVDHMNAILKNEGESLFNKMI